VNLVLLLTTAAKKSDARRLAESALRHRVAACVQILPMIESHYLWKGKKEIAREFLVLAKTTSSRRKDLLKLWSKIHPYHCPELVTLTGKAASAYARWVKASTSD
jgi:periplasmic divalent cation tolerance protein